MVVVMEDLLDASAEEPGDREGERQRGQVAPGLDRVHRLARDAQLRGELAPAQAEALAAAISLSERLPR